MANHTTLTPICSGCRTRPDLGTPVQGDQDRCVQCGELTTFRAAGGDVAISAQLDARGPVAVLNETISWCDANDREGFAKFLRLARYLVAKGWKAEDACDRLDVATTHAGIR